MHEPHETDKGRNPENPTDETKRRGRRLRLVSLVFILLVAGASGAFFIAQALGETKAKAAGEQGSQEQAEEVQAAEDGEAKEKAPVPVKVAEVATGEVSAYITAAANLVAENEVMVLAEADGRLESLKVDEGQRVDSGQVLATLVQGDQQITVSKARVKETDARLAYERGQKLVAEELISREAFDALKVSHEIARQELAEAEWGLTKTVIRAPFTGRVSQRLVQVGQHVQPGQELFQITDFEPLIARIYLPEKDILGLTEGRDVRIALNADAGVRFTGRIRQISPVVDTATGTVKVTVEAVSPPRDVRPGSFVTLGIVRESRQRAVLVPREAVVRELKTAHVFIEQDGVAVKRAVALGLEEGDWVEAVSGVAEGERVIVAGQGGLRDGTSVKILDADNSEERS